MTELNLPRSFEQSYSDLLLNVWRDEDEMRKLLANPTKYATEVGLPVTAGSTVVIEGLDRTELPRKAEVLENWNGTPGRHIIVVPREPLVDLAELSDAELDIVTAGDNNNNVRNSIFFI
jgi:hypothetical protein